MYTDSFVFSVLAFCVGIMGFFYGLTAIKEIKELQARVLQIEKKVDEVNRKLYQKI
ncbi:MAG: hypothetical protein JJE29_03950 [Peptostreptococcaceae bacterium]|nr:hypothetical protein [Peptostreptococcaceae bacterium]